MLNQNGLNNNMENIKEVKVSKKTNIENAIYTCINFLDKKKGIVKLFAIGNARNNLREIIEKISIKRPDIYKYSKYKKFYSYQNLDEIILTLEKKKFEYPKDYKLIENTKTNINMFGNIYAIKIKKNFQKDVHPINKINKDEIIIRYKINYLYTLKIFDSEFVKNNKKHCKIIFNNIEQDLVDILQIKYNYNFMNNYELTNKYIEIKLKGMENITDMSYMFYKCSNLLSVSNISNLDTSKVKNMSCLFYDCESLLSLPEILNWNTSKVIDMSYMFYNCTSLIYLPDISKFDLSNVKYMVSMFNGCSSLISLPDIEKWNIHNAIDMNSLFCNCLLLNTLPDISKWNTSNITNMNSLFNNCTSLKSVPDISKWNTSKVTIMRCMFFNCKSLTILPNISKWDISYKFNV